MIRTFKSFAAMMLVGLTLFLIPTTCQNQPQAAQGTSQESEPLKVSDNGRYFVRNGKPFFWLGDAVWSLFTLYAKEEAETYLEHRKKQGFNVFQTMIVFDGGPGLKTRYGNTEGNEPFFDMDPATPNEAFFKNVDQVIEIARQKGLVIYILPCGGSGGSFVHQKKVFTKKTSEPMENGWASGTRMFPTSSG